MKMSFNISKTEFIAYLDCPMKFYIIKDLNQNAPYGQRGERDYSAFPEHSKVGMRWHKTLEGFHEKYEATILTGEPPTIKNPSEERILKVFYQLEKERYKKDPENWYPVETELYLETNQCRGIIDRIDKLSTEDEYRIVEYKGKERVHLEQELLFYANLFQESFPDKAVTEIASFSYLSGSWRVMEISQKDIKQFKKNLEEIIKEMYSQNWTKTADCKEKDIPCSFRQFCHLLQIIR